MKKKYLWACASVLTIVAASHATAQDGGSDIPDFILETGAMSAGSLGNVQIFYDAISEQYWMIPEGANVVLKGDIFTRGGENITQILPRPNAEDRFEGDGGIDDLVRSPEQALVSPSVDVQENTPATGLIGTLSSVESLDGGDSGMMSASPDRQSDAEGVASEFGLFDVPLDDRPIEEQTIIRNELITMLFEELEKAETPDEYGAFLSDWSRLVEGVMIGQTPDQISSNQDGLTEFAAQFISSSGRDLPGVTFGSDAPEKEIQSSTMIGSEDRMEPQVLLTEIEGGAFWFGVGNQDGPVVYAFIDPTCPFCARAMKQLQQVVENGELGLRIVLTPILGQKSGPVTAGILASEDPVQAFWRHELSYADFGNSDVRPVDPNTLNIEYRRALQENSDLFLKSGMSGVPAFVLNTSENGAVAMEGIPATETLLKALPRNRNN